MPPEVSKVSGGRSLAEALIFQKTVESLLSDTLRIARVAVLF